MGLETLKQLVWNGTGNPKTAGVEWDWCGMGLETLKQLVWNGTGNPKTAVAGLIYVCAYVGTIILYHRHTCVYDFYTKSQVAMNMILWQQRYTRGLCVLYWQ